jgi:protein-disulfide isomerase-like protein with CxxC motif
MAGIKTRKGTVQIQPKYFVKGREVKPCQVYQKKISSNGFKMLRSANYLDTGEVVKNHQGRAMPWNLINFD